jgi:preprotein translocase subunit SecA
MAKLGMEEDQPIEHSMITKAIENAQRKVEAHNFDIRKQLLEYDVMTKQREVIYSQRRDILEAEDIHDVVKDIIHGGARGLLLRLIFLWMPMPTTGI